jgi:hypothetical protein
MPGGSRPRPINTEDMAVWQSGRWGPRRMRVTECHGVVNAEDVYTRLIDENLQALEPGAKGMVNAPTGRYCGQRDISVAWEVRANRLWRFGRLFLRCPRCRQRVTRIYLPYSTDSPACRQCYGLTYESRQRRNYKLRGGLSGAFDRTFGSVAVWQTFHEREQRARAARERQADRRAILKEPRWNPVGGHDVASDVANAFQGVASHEQRPREKLQPRWGPVSTSPFA